MDEITPVVDTGLLIPGHDLPPDRAVEVAAAWLAARGVGEWDIYDAQPDMRPTRAWWVGGELGFVGQGHAHAVPVVVVHLPSGVQTQIISAPPKGAA